MNTSSLNRFRELDNSKEQRFAWEEFVEEIKQVEFDFPKLKIPYLAQCILESGRGSSKLFRLAGNPTGIKFREEMRGFTVPIELSTSTEPQGEEWCSWNTPTEAFRGYWRFISRPIYAGWDDFTDNPRGYINHIFNCGYAEDPKYVEKVVSLFPNVQELLGDKNMLDMLIATWFNLDLGSDNEAILYAMNDGESVSSQKSKSKSEFVGFLNRHSQANTLRLSQKIKEVDKNELTNLQKDIDPRVTWFQFWRTANDSSVLIGFMGGTAINFLTSNNVQYITNFLESHSNANTVQAANMSSPLKIATTQSDSLHIVDDHHGSNDAMLRPKIKWVSGCNNFSSRSDIDSIVLHYTTSRNINGSISWFRNEDSQVSAHYIVGRDGEIYQLVRDADKAWHCRGFNATSIGIEHSAVMGDSLTPQQEAASAQLIRWLCAEYKISPSRIFGHRWNPVSPDQSDCPGSLWKSSNELKMWVDQNITRSEVGGIGEHRQPSMARESAPAPNNLEQMFLESSFELNITPHIQYGEICKWQEKRRFLTQGQCDIAVIICKYLETVRSHFGDRALIITSGHRPRPINEQQGGVWDSEHLYENGRGAIDFYIEGINIYDVQKYCLETWPHSVGKGAPKGFVHIGYGRGKVQWIY
jgi:N-acetylmuramoyl-L-alanine amidase/Peptidase M15/Mannosyl-glycoprotein endo-beta-N-acetylglucosaminidase